ncbi:hypothetical protein WJ978_31165 [Achromobacter xylosoxidans]
MPVRLLQRLAHLLRPDIEVEIIRALGHAVGLDAVHAWGGETDDCMGRM